MWILAHKSVPVQKIPRYELKNIFLGEQNKWKNGDRLSIAVQVDNDVTKSFLNAYIGKTPEQFYSYWKRVAYTGKWQMPMVCGSDEDIYAYASSTPGCIAYVAANSCSSNRIQIIEVQENVEEGLFD